MPILEEDLGLRNSYFIENIYLLTLTHFILMTDSRFVLRLPGVVSPWTGQHYIGFVLDVLDKCLDWNADYYLPNSNEPLANITGMSMVRWDQKRKRNDRIGVYQVLDDEGRVLDGEYLIIGLPYDTNMNILEERARSVLEDYHAILVKERFRQGQ